MVKFSRTGAVLSLLGGWLAVGCATEQPMAKTAAPAETARAAAEVKPAAPARASGGIMIPDKVLADHGFTTLWTKQPMEGSFRSVHLLPEGIFAVTGGREARTLRLVRYSLENGLPLWSYPLDESLDHPPVAYHYAVGGESRPPDELFILQKDVIRCLDLQYGAEMWRIHLPFSVSCAPVVDERNFYIGSYNRRIFAYPKNKGVELWPFVTGGEVKSAGALGSSGQIYFTCTDKSVYRLEPINGFVRGKSWTFQTGGRVLGSPVFFSRWVYVGSTDFKLYAFEVDGTRAWDFPAEAPIVQTPVVVSFRPDKPIAFCISEDDRRGDEKRVAWAVDARTGTELWRRIGVQQVVAIGRRAVYLIPDARAGGERRLIGVDALKGDELSSLPLGSFDIVPTNDAVHGTNPRTRGTIFLISKSGTMQAIREKP